MKLNLITTMSQKQQILDILSDYEWHSSPEFQERMFGSTKYGLFRLGARIWDLKKDGHLISGKKDSNRATIYWYKLEPRPVFEPIWREKVEQMSLL